MPHRLLELERVGDDSFVAQTQWRGYDRLYGGQVAAQSLRAACSTVELGRLPHSLHSYFILAGRAGEPVQLDVQRTRDGRSFSTRHVTASQGGKAIFELVSSFHVHEDGDDWQLPPPADLALPAAPRDGSMPRWDGLGGVFEIRPEHALPEYDPFALHPVWLRTAERLDDDPVTHQCLLTFLSDLGVLGSTRAPGTRTSYRNAASLDHSVWFHRPARVDEWLRFSSAPVTNFGARGMARAELHTEAGAHVASVAQESLLRPLR